MSDYREHRCDFCSGTVRPMTTEREPVRLGSHVVLLDGLIVGKCDHCGHQYYPADVLKLAERVAEHPEEAARFESIPVAAA